MNKTHALAVAVLSAALAGCPGGGGGGVGGGAGNTGGGSGGTAGGTGTTGGGTESTGGGSGTAGGAGGSTGGGTATLPMVTIDMPAEGELVTDSSVTLSFTSSTAGATFECELDATAFGTCTSPHTFQNVSNGSHSATVHAIAAGVTGPNATRNFIVQAPAPVVTLSGSPANNDVTRSTSASFTFTANRPNVTFTCKLDNGTFDPCSSPQPLTALAEGPHTFSVKGTDVLGLVSAPATVSWTIDSTAPVVVLSATPPSVTAQTSASFTFSATDASQPLTMQCKLDTAGFGACTTSTSMSYTGLGAGSHTFTVQSTDPAGNVGTQAYSWTVDTTAPTVTLTAMPAALSASSAAALAWNVDETGTTQTCQLDALAPTGCSGSIAYNTLGDGPHTFTVTAVDAAGNTGRATWSWTIDTTAPVVTFTARPANPTNAAMGAFAWTVSELAASSCSLDGAAPAACGGTSGGMFTTSALPDGMHSLRVTATDAAGNAGSASYSWSVDTTPPQVTLGATPANPTASLTASFTWSNSETIGSASCQLDTGAATPCGSLTSQSYGLVSANATHTFTVIVTDLAGNTRTASYSWRTDTAGPVIAFTSSPTDPSSVTSGTITWTTNDASSPISAPTCALDGVSVACTTSSSLNYVRLAAETVHRFTVTATDGLGNVGSASVTWHICIYSYYVDVATGSDSAAGSCLAPVKTITRGLALAGSTPNLTVKVAPGTYSAAGGETFPLTLNNGTVLLGDIAAFGASTKLTGRITVNGPSVLQGFYLDAASLSGATIVSLAGSSPGLLYATVANSPAPGYQVDIAAGATNALLYSVEVKNNINGILVESSGAQIFNSLIHHNTYGVDFHAPMDFSPGGNQVYCNVSADVYWFSGAAPNMSNVKWDHVPPTMSSTISGGVDIGTSLTGINTSNASLVASPCP